MSSVTTRSSSAARSAGAVAFQACREAVTVSVLIGVLLRSSAGRSPAVLGTTLPPVRRPVDDVGGHDGGYVPGYRRAHDHDAAPSGRRPAARLAAAPAPVPARPGRDRRGV